MGVKEKSQLRTERNFILLRQRSSTIYEIERNMGSKRVIITFRYDEAISFHRLSIQNKINSHEGKLVIQKTAIVDHKPCVTFPRGKRDKCPRWHFVCSLLHKYRHLEARRRWNRPTLLSKLATWSWSLIFWMSAKGISFSEGGGEIPSHLIEGPASETRYFMNSLSKPSIFFIIVSRSASSGIEPSNFSSSELSANCGGGREDINGKMICSPLAYYF